MTLKITTTAGNSSASTNSTNGLGSSLGPHKANIGAIAGGVVGGVVAVALGFLGAAMLQRHGQRRILRLFSHLKSPSTSASTLEEGSSPAELMEHNKVNWGGVCAVELPSGEVAKEMDTGP